MKILKFIFFICVLLLTVTSWAVKPNIVYILADDMGIGDVTVYNPSKNVSNTINMDALAAGGMRFTNAHTPSAICSPTRYGLMTGDHPYHIGKEAQYQKAYDDVYLKDPNKRTIANVLRDAGYRTGYSGKWHLGYTVYKANGEVQTGSSELESVQPDWSKGIANHPFDRGFDFAFGHVASADIPPYKYFQDDKWVNLQSTFITRDLALSTGVIDKPADGGVSSLRNGWMDTDWDFNQIQRKLKDKAIEFIRSTPDTTPFFLYLPLSAPHAPLAPNPDYQKKTPYNFTDYVKEVDEIVGNIVNELKARNIYKNTLIIVTSDNGANANEANKSTHRATGILEGVTLRGSKTTTHEGGHRVAFIAHWGDDTPEGSVIKPGAVTNDLINLQDFFRTAAAIVEEPITASEGVDSWNILPILLGDGTLLRLREANFSISRFGHWIITKQYPDGSEWKLIFSSGTGGWSSTTDPKGTKEDPKKLFANLNFANLQLFNLTTDLGESTNVLSNGVSATETQKVKELHALMNDYLASGTSNTKDPNTAKVPTSIVKDRGSKRVSQVFAYLKNNSTVLLNVSRSSYQNFLVEITNVKGAVVFSKKITRNRDILPIQLPKFNGELVIFTVKSHGKPIYQNRFIIM